MTAISKETATQIALAYREIEVAEKLLEDVRKAADAFGREDIRDAFGRTRHGLELGIPSGDTSRRLFNVPYPIAVPIIEAHIAQHRALISVLSTKALIETAEQTAGSDQ